MKLLHRADQTLTDVSTAAATVDQSAASLVLLAVVGVFALAVIAVSVTRLANHAVRY